MTDKYSLPVGWVWTRVGKIYDIVGGGTPSTEVTEYWKGDIPWITSADIHGLKDIRPRRCITRKAIENSATNLVPEGSLIVVTRVGLGKTALTKTPICFSQDSQALIDTSSSLYPDYSLYYLSQAVQIFKYKHRGTTIDGVIKKQLSELAFAFPPLPEQRRIVAKIEELFTKLDAGVEALKKVKVQLKRYRQAVLKHAFEGRLTEEWREIHREIEPASVLLERMKKERKKNTKGKFIEVPSVDLSDLPELPEGWVWTRAQEVCDWITNGDTPKADKMFQGKGEIPFIKVYNLTTRGVLDFSINPTFISRETHTKELARSKIFPGDVLMNIVGPPLGKVSIVPPTYPKWNTNQAVVIFRPLSGYDRKFLCFSLLTENVLSWAKKQAKATAGQFNLTITICRNLPLPLPTLTEQHRIVEEIERRFSAADEVEKVVEQSLGRAARLRQGILKKAFEGKLVSQDPNDEPAEKLLERIKVEKAKQEARRKGKRRIKGKRA